ncbi:hypothetical protein RJG79_08315 [Mycoplasmatota bacterium WC44]
MLWKDIDFLIYHFNLNRSEYAYFVGYDESTVRHYSNDGKEFSPKKSVIEKTLTLFLPINRSLDGLEKLVEKIKNGDDYLTTKNYVKSRIDINKSFNKLRDEQLSKWELLSLKSYTVYSHNKNDIGKVTEHEIENDYLNLFSYIKNNSIDLKNTLERFKNKGVKKIDYSNIVILSFDIDYSCNKVIDFEFRVPIRVQPTGYSLQLYVQGPDDEEGRDVYVYPDKNQEYTDIISKNDYTSRDLEFVDFVKLINKLYTEHFNGRKILMFTDELDDEYRYLLSNLFNNYFTRKLRKLKIEFLNDYLQDDRIFQLKFPYSLFEFACGLGFPCSREKILSDCHYRNEVITQVIDFLMMRKVDMSHRKKDATNVWGPSEDFYKNYKSKDELIEYRRKTYKKGGM